MSTGTSVTWLPKHDRNKAAINCPASLEGGKFPRLQPETVNCRQLRSDESRRNSLSLFAFYWARASLTLFCNPGMSRIHCVTYVGLQFIEIVLFQPCECCNYKHVPSCEVLYCIIFFKIIEIYFQMRGSYTVKFFAIILRADLPGHYLITFENIAWKSSL